jgi:hypothetical protein
MVGTVLILTEYQATPRKTLPDLPPPRVSPTIPPLLLDSGGCKSPITKPPSWLKPRNPTTTGTFVQPHCQNEIAEEATEEPEDVLDCYLEYLELRREYESLTGHTSEINLMPDLIDNDYLHLSNDAPESLQYSSSPSIDLPPFGIETESSTLEPDDPRYVILRDSGRLNWPPRKRSKGLQQDSARSRSASKTEERTLYPSPEERSPSQEMNELKLSNESVNNPWKNSTGQREPSPRSLVGRREAQSHSDNEEVDHQETEKEIPDTKKESPRFASEGHALRAKLQDKKIRRLPPVPPVKYASLDRVSSHSITHPHALSTSLPHSPVGSPSESFDGPRARSKSKELPPSPKRIALRQHSESPETYSPRSPRFNDDESPKEKDSPRITALRAQEVQEEARRRPRTISRERQIPQASPQGQGQGQGPGPGQAPPAQGPTLSFTEVGHVQISPSSTRTSSSSREFERDPHKQEAEGGEGYEDSPSKGSSHRPARTMSMRHSIKKSPRSIISSTGNFFHEGRREA